MLRRRSRGLIACVALLAGNADAQSSEPAKACESEEFRALDFWIGEWRVTWKTPEGQPAEGRNSIRRILDGCAVEEDWRGGDGSQGKSVTFLDPTAKRWHQTWIDNTAQPLLLDGNFEDESLVLEARTGEGFTETFHRITWTPLAGGLRQHWEQSQDGKKWRTVFDGRYERINGQPRAARKGKVRFARVEAKNPPALVNPRFAEPCRSASASAPRSCGSRSSRSRS